MNRKHQLLLVLVFIAVSLYLVKSDSYVRFYPIIWSAEYDELVIDDINMSDEFYINSEKVLIHYKEDYEKGGGIVYVKKTLYKDKDLCWNYTSKANNKVWLHPK